jgi:hypothetical protein
VIIRLMKLTVMTKTGRGLVRQQQGEAGSNVCAVKIGDVAKILARTAWFEPVHYYAVIELARSV